VSEQNLVKDESGKPVRHAQIGTMFTRDKNGSYRAKPTARH